MATYKESTGKSIEQSFREYFKKNPHIYREFEKRAFQLIKAGNKKISSKMIINNIRWSVATKEIDTTNESYAINDAYTPYYARVFVHFHPQYADRFELRKIRSK